ncbi:hypothetical protein POF50_028845 [Streptomyces sp. SL13]|jgi:hypothetical protein|uniref:Uncharacterized protein n=1 Tax=Streptantibioticus silvisoli TaxID=2705255 RepID=A0AA90KIL0_9ACTN|nr:hypothetical protein [Streptantibioticus silvisoli]MDI5961359.1 hypothetical protein [Streptantibioticus silvisoli]MDI5973305.1 hypothetical protein [Streptantibioticus silvisoli]
MSERNTALRSMHDLGLAAWLGGSLMGAVGVNGVAAQEGRTELSTARMAGIGWSKWAPIGAVAVGAHLIGASGLLAANSDRVKNQAGVGVSSAAKVALTAAALAATVYTRALGKKVDLVSSDDPEDQETAAQMPVDFTQARRQLSVMQWIVPGLTAGLVVLGALQGEQQRPSQQGAGVLLRAARERLPL